MRLRLHGTGAEVAEATRRLLQALEVIAVSDPYLDRGASVLVRVYLEVRLDVEATGPTRSSPGRFPDPAEPATRARRRPRRELGGRWSG